MFIPDLATLPPGRPPSPYPFPLPLKSADRWGVGSLPDGLTLLPVGWLGASVPESGSAPEEFIDKLLAAYVAKSTFTDGTAGWHDCEFCPGAEAWYPGGQVGPIIKWRDREQRLYGHGHYLVRHGLSVFMAPSLILHYILDHSYRPPDQFIQAVMHGSFLGPADLNWDESSPREGDPAA